MRQITVMSGPERRRRWSDEQRLQILAEACAPGACVADVARQYDISTARIYTWRRKLCQPVARPDFVQAVVVDDSESAASAAALVIVLDLAGAGRVSVRRNGFEVTELADVTTPRWRRRPSQSVSRSSGTLLQPFTSRDNGVEIAGTIYKSPRETVLNFSRSSAASL